ncbi:hypothetical protein BOTBODRAFT_27241 [Botryobasidium botryosum FD-172 SS1]|uniref:BAR-domain-containing protein n=1 Tax=Botryobasidium botryosum (strain FD-172 SS1) TaxID=930990 RepID=A0A067N6V0_BOTB1|nr:hypothetical protein BOTBODRAFT_27241 [Botryobasidium botryosum FD-172 SS1]
MGKKSNDPEFDDYNRKFTALEASNEKLIKDCKVFCDAVVSLLTSGANFASHFAVIFAPMSGEYDLIGKHPQSADTVRNAAHYQTEMEELRQSLTPELELIESRVAGPSKELQAIVKQIRKTILKRDHKLVDFDRFNNSLTKLREKKEKTLSDEKNLFKLEQDFELAVNEYEYYNNTLKTELPQFMVLATQFIDPLFHSFYYMQLNIFYLTMEKLRGFAEKKYSLASTGAEIEAAYLEAKTDAATRIEDLAITKRVVSTAKLMAQSRGTLSPSGSSMGAGSMRRSPSSVSSGTPSTYSLAGKKAPPPPPGSASMAAPPPPYSAPSPGSSVSALSGKRAPPPPPPLKPKPKPAPEIKYVVALYDFTAQADGDLDFSAGDRIELVQRTASAEDWWTGKVNGRQGVFPGNYVQET